jgi:predicted kinase
MPTLIMMIGHPYCGKSTFIINFLVSKNQEDWSIVSTDKWIEQEAFRRGKDYQTVFGTYADTATKLMWEEVPLLVKARKNIIWDQTNLTTSTRAKKLAPISADYRKIAVYFPALSEDELAKRIKIREKFVSHGIVNAMIRQLEPPTLDEGFHRIIHQEHVAV